MIPANIQAIKNAEQSRKVLLTKIHRVVDAYISGTGATACMAEIKKIIGRAS